MLRSLSLLTLALVSVAPASAATVVVAGTPSTFHVVFDGNVGTQQVAGLSAALTVTLLGTSPDGKTYKFGYSLLNTSSGAITASRVSGFAFDTTPNISGASASGLFSNAVFKNAKLPNQVGSVDVCITDGNVCQGGRNGGLLIGKSGTGNFSLTFATAQSQITFDDFAVRYQSITGTNFGNSGTGEAKIITAVPEAATWMMMFVGFGMVGTTLRYRRRPSLQPASA